MQVFSFFRIAAPPLAIAGLVAISVPMQPAAARTNEYQSCAAALRDAGIGEARVAEACAAALKPVDLASCVSSVVDGTDIEARAALNGCRRVRRPLEFATCVVNIEGAAGAEVIDHCRRSLLPVRFSECVVGLVAETNYDASTAMGTCIAASTSRPGNASAAPEPEPAPDFPPSPPAQ